MHPWFSVRLVLPSREGLGNFWKSAYHSEWRVLLAFGGQGQPQCSALGSREVKDLFIANMKIAQNPTLRHMQTKRIFHMIQMEHQNFPGMQQSCKRREDYTLPLFSWNFVKSCSIFQKRHMTDDMVVYGT